MSFFVLTKNLTLRLLFFGSAGLVLSSQRTLIDNLKEETKTVGVKTTTTVTLVLDHLEGKIRIIIPKNYN